MVVQNFLLSLLVLCPILYVAHCEVDDNQRANIREQQQQHSGKLGLYPRVGKRNGGGPTFQMMRRRDLLNYLADNWQQTGSFLNDVPDMTESKRAAVVKVRSPSALLFPAPRVGRSDPEFRDGDEIVKKWAVARMGKKWAAARVGKKSSPSSSSGEQDDVVGEPEKRVPFARVG